MSKNLNALDELLAKAKTSESSRPLWRELLERIDEINEALNAGITKKAMAEEAGVSSTNFNLAYKKASSMKGNVEKTPSTLPSVPNSKSIKNINL